jgi:hypothetical protein
VQETDAFLLFMIVIDNLGYRPLVDPASGIRSLYFDDLFVEMPPRVM